MERLEDWSAGACFPRAVRRGARAGAGLHPSTSKPARNRQRAPAVGGDFLLYCRAGRTLLPGLGAEPAGTSCGTPGGSGDCVGVVRTVALQQTVRTFQLALCAAGYYRGDLLWTRVAAAAASAGLDDYPRERRLVVGALVLRRHPCAA